MGSLGIIAHAESFVCAAVTGSVRADNLVQIPLIIGIAVVPIVVMPPLHQLFDDLNCTLLCLVSWVHTDLLENCVNKGVCIPISSQYPLSPKPRYSGRVKLLLYSCWVLVLHVLLGYRNGAPNPLCRIF